MAASATPKFRQRMKFKKIRPWARCSGDESGSCDFSTTLHHDYGVSVISRHERFDPTVDTAADDNLMMTLRELVFRVGAGATPSAASSVKSRKLTNAAASNEC